MKHTIESFLGVLLLTILLAVGAPADANVRSSQAVSAAVAVVAFGTLPSSSQVPDSGRGIQLAEDDDDGDISPLEPDDDDDGDDGDEEDDDG